VTRVLYLDRYHLGDPLFLNGLARALATALAPTILVHGAAEDGERALEARGRFPRWEGDVLEVADAEEAAIVERTARDLNRRIAHALNEAGVAAVRADGASRGLLAMDPEGEVRAGATAWLADLLRQGIVPVVAALVPEGETVREVSGGAVTGALAQALADGVAVFLARRPLGDGEAASEALGDPAAARAGMTTGANTHAVTPRDLGAMPWRGRDLTGLL
jgi:acetylglutamate kinase